LAPLSRKKGAWVVCGQVMWYAKCYDAVVKKKKRRGQTGRNPTQNERK